MKAVYIFGPIHLFGEDYIPIYKKLTKLCENYFDKVLCTYPDFWNTGESPKEFYQRTYDEITKCDLFIAEVSSPSIGVGMEFQMAQEKDIPCIALCKSGHKVSSMIDGIPCLRKIIYYDDVDDLTYKLEKYLKSANFI